MLRLKILNLTQATKTFRKWAKKTALLQNTQV